MNTLKKSIVSHGIDSLSKISIQMERPYPLKQITVENIVSC